MEEEHHLLDATWALWAHFPRNNNWNDTSSSLVTEITTAEEIIALNDLLPTDVTTKGMLFLMRKNVAPLYEDPVNANGGAFSYRVTNADVPSTWRQVTYALVGETLSTNPDIVPTITGVTISPKKNFCIIKIWMSTTEHSDPAQMALNIPHLSSAACLFKPHPKY